MTQKTLIIMSKPHCLLMKPQDKRKRLYIDAQKLCDQSILDVIIPLHAMTGSDHTSGFYGKGKKLIALRVAESAHAINLLESLGRDINISEETISNSVEFVIKYIYNDEKSKTPGEARLLKWKSQKKKISQARACDSCLFLRLE